MSLIQYISARQVIPQADFEASVDDNGLWTGSQSFIIQKGLLDDPSVRMEFGIGRPITELDPHADSVWNFLRIRRIQPSTEVGGWTRVYVHLQGFSVGSAEAGQGGQPADDEVFVTYSMRGETSDAPLVDHPKFKALPISDQILLGRLAEGFYTWGISNPDADIGDWVFELQYTDGREGDAEELTNNADTRQFANRIASGMTTYRRGGFTWAKRWSSKTPLTSTQLNLLGKISNPPGPAPSPGNGRTYLLVSAGFEMAGNEAVDPTYTNEIVFELSDNGGHDTFLQT